MAHARKDIIYYAENAFEPVDHIEWGQVLSLLHSGFDPRFCGTTAEADNNIRNGVTGDTLAAFESFAHLVWAMVQKKEISVTDKWPFALKPSRHVHANLDYLLGEYAGLLTGDKAARDKAWKMVEACFDHNGFTDDVKAAVSKQVYNTLEIFVSKAAGLANENAMVLVRANPKMPFLDEDAFGDLGKRGNKNLRLPYSHARYGQASSIVRKKNGVSRSSAVYTLYLRWLPTHRLPAISLCPWLNPTCPVSFPWNSR